LLDEDDGKKPAKVSISSAVLPSCSVAPHSLTRTAIAPPCCCPWPQPVAPNTGKMTPQSQFDRMPAGKPAAGKPAPAKPSVKDPGHSHGDGHDHHDD
jgi:hypothetical protein